MLSYDIRKLNEQQNPFVYAEVWAKQTEYIVKDWDDFLSYAGASSDCFYDFTLAVYSQGDPNHFITGSTSTKSFSLGTNENRGVAIIGRHGTRGGNIGDTQDTDVNCGGFQQLGTAYNTTALRQHITTAYTVAAGEDLSVWVYLLSYSSKKGSGDYYDENISFNLCRSNYGDGGGSEYSLDTKVYKMSELGLYPITANASNVASGGRWCRIDFTDLSYGTDYTGGTSNQKTIVQIKSDYAPSSVYIPYATGPDQDAQTYSGGSWSYGAYDTLYFVHHDDATQYYYYELDYGSTPTEYPRFFINYATPTGTTLTWDVKTSDSAMGSVVSRGQYNNGDIIPFKHRYTQVVVAMTTDAQQYETPRLYNVGVIYPDNKFNFSSKVLNNLPTSASIKSIGQRNNKIDIYSFESKPVSSFIEVSNNEYSQRLFYEKHDETAGAKENWKNSPVYVQIGFDDKAKDNTDFLPFFSGKLTGVGFSREAIELTVDDGLVDLNKVTVPSPELPTTTGSSTIYVIDDNSSEDRISPISYVAENPIDVIADLINNWRNMENKAPYFLTIDGQRTNFKSFYESREALNSVYSNCIQRGNVNVLVKNATDNYDTGDRTVEFYDDAPTSYGVTIADDFANGLEFYTYYGNTYKIADYEKDGSGSKDVITVDRPWSESDQAWAGNSNYTYVIRTWDTRLRKPEKVKKLIDQIAELFRILIYVDESGLINCKAYDSTDASVRDWDENIIRKITCEHDVDYHFFQRCIVFYNWDGKGNEIENYGRAQLYVDDDARDEWGESNIKTIYTQWLNIPEELYGGDTAAAQIAQDYVDQFKNGVLIFDVETSFRQYDIQLGDMVTLILKNGVWVKPESKADGVEEIKCLVVGKNVDPIRRKTIKWTLFEAT